MSWMNGHVRKRVAIDVFDASLTHQSEKDETDINFIVARARRTGMLPAATEGFYGDFTNIPDLGEAFRTVELANQSFLGLPSDIRKRFNNNPAEFGSWLVNPANLDEARKLGLRKPAPVAPETTGAPSTPV